MDYIGSRTGTFADCLCEITPSAQPEVDHHEEPRLAVAGRRSTQEWKEIIKRIIEENPKIKQKEIALMTDLSPGRICQLRS